MSPYVDKMLAKLNISKAELKAMELSQYKDIDLGAIPIDHVQATFYVRNRSFQAAHTQFPLYLCWAVTIHKTQGMTIDEVVADMTPLKGHCRNRKHFLHESC